MYMSRLSFAVLFRNLCTTLEDIVGSKT